MRTVLLCVALGLAVLAGGCKREPTFEERYDAANKAIVDRAKQIDAQIAGHSVSPPKSEQPSEER